MSDGCIVDADHGRTAVELLDESYTVAAATCGGRRGCNEDCFEWIASSDGRLSGETMFGPVEPEDRGLPDFLMAVVCDGLGGMRDGEKASRFVVEGMVGWAASGGLTSRNPAEGIVKAAMAVEDRLRSRHPFSATTMSVVTAVDGRWTSAHLGDSRCYAVYPDRIWRTRDHSKVERLYREGRITEDQMNTHPESNVMDRCMGVGDSMDTEVRDIEEGWGRLALCSDGAFGYMTVAEFGSILRGTPDASGIVEAAYDRGSTDNITVLTIDGPVSRYMRSNVQIK